MKQRVVNFLIVPLFIACSLWATTHVNAMANASLPAYTTDNEISSPVHIPVIASDFHRISVHSEAGVTGHSVLAYRKIQNKDFVFLHIAFAKQISHSLSRQTVFFRNVQGILRPPLIVFPFHSFW
jgi:hypothetical protein